MLIIIIIVLTIIIIIIVIWQIDFFLLFLCNSDIIQNLRVQASCNDAP